MACNYPVGLQDKDGIAVMRPCSTCIACRLDYSKEWALRLSHESQLYQENDFITLTYNQENLPQDGSIHKRELEKFIKRLRSKLYPKTIRYYGCGEYGKICKTCGLSRPYCIKEGCKKFIPILGRPHYHAIIFNHSFTNKEPLFLSPKRYGFRKSGADHTLYRSGQLERMWKKGFSTVGDVTPESAAYIARYVTKKINGKEAEKHYGNKSSEFSLMSRNPGIGHDWFQKYKTDIFPKGYCTLNGKRYKFPRYYYSLLEKQNEVEARFFKYERRKQAIKKPYENTIRGYQKELYQKKVAEPLKRGYEE